MKWRKKTESNVGALRIRKFKRFLNSISHENSEFFEVETRFQTGGGVFENGPPFFLKNSE